MSSSRRETRSEATARVTCSVAAWLWRERSRVLAQEVGLGRGRPRLCAPWGAAYRVDLAAVVSHKTYVVEVKGTRADIVREDLGAGKWTMAYADHGLMPWLAFDARIDPRLYSQLPETWGLLRVDAQRVKVLRRPPRVYDDNLVESLTAIASVACMQTLPMMMGKNHSEQLAALERGGFARPWRHWLEDDKTTIEEPGHIL